MEKTGLTRSLVTSELCGEGSQAQILLAEREKRPAEQSKIHLI